MAAKRKNAPARAKPGRFMVAFEDRSEEFDSLEKAVENAKTLCADDGDAYVVLKVIKVAKPTQPSVAVEDA